MAWEELSSKESILWPVKLRNAPLIQRILKPKDVVMIYLTKKSVIAGMVEVSGNLRMLQKSLLFQDDIYEAVIPISVKKKFEGREQIDVRALKDELQVTKNVGQRWGIRLQRAIVQLSDADYELLYSKIARSQ